MNSFKLSVKWQVSLFFYTVIFNIYTGSEKVKHTGHTPVDRLYSDYIYFSVDGKDRSPQRYHHIALVDGNKFVC